MAEQPYPILASLKDVLRAMRGSPDDFRAELVRYLRDTGPVIQQPVQAQNTAIVLASSLAGSLTSIGKIVQFIAGEITMLGLVSPGYIVWCESERAEAVMKAYDRDLGKIVSAAPAGVSLSWCPGASGLQDVPDAANN